MIRVPDNEIVVVIDIKQNPTKEDAIKACIAWFDAESKNIGSSRFKMDLCHYSEWACRKSMGQDVGEYKGLPRITLTIDNEEVK